MGLNVLYKSAWSWMIQDQSLVLSRMRTSICSLIFVLKLKLMVQMDCMLTYCDSGVWYSRRRVKIQQILNKCRIHMPPRETMISSAQQDVLYYLFSYIIHLSPPNSIYWLFIAFGLFNAGKLERVSSVCTQCIWINYRNLWW